MRYYNVVQGEDRWFELRKGVPTASCFDRIITPAKAQLSAAADGYIAELIGEQLSLIPPEGVENYTNRAIRWGQQTEAEARRYYQLERGTDVGNGGFCMTDDGRFGASPDFLVGIEVVAEWSAELHAPTVYEVVKVKGAGELKCPQAGTQVAYVLAGTLPMEYKAQVHGHLIVTEAAWCDFLSYAPGLPPLLVRVERDEFTDKLSAALEQFWDRYQTTLKRIKG